MERRGSVFLIPLLFISLSFNLYTLLRKEPLAVPTEVAEAQQSLPKAQSNQTFQTQARQGQGQGRKIYIDLGTNEGSSVRYFMDPATTKTQKDTAKFYDTEVIGGGKSGSLQGKGQDGLWHVIIVEANVKFKPSLEEVRNDYFVKRKMAQSFHLYAPTAIATHDGEITFYLDSLDEGGFEGSTTMKDSFSAIGANVSVPALDIVSLFDKHHITTQDFVILKMDVEGLEYDLLRHMFMQGLHKRIDILAAEYHDDNEWVFGRDKTADELKKKVKYKQARHCLKWMMDSAPYMRQEKWN